MTRTAKMATRGPKGAHDLQVGPHNGHEDRHQERLVIPGSTPELPSSHQDLNNGRDSFMIQFGITNL